MFHFNIIFRARFRLDIFFQKTVELSVSHSFHLFNLILRYNIKVQGSNLKMYSGVTLGLQKIIYSGQEYAFHVRHSPGTRVSPWPGVRRCR